MAEIDNVQFAVRNESLLIVLWFNCQAIIRRPVTAEGKIQYRSSPCRICGGQNYTRRGFLEKITFSSVSSYYYSRPPYSRSPSCCYATVTTGRSLENFKRKYDLS
jgi:hypothetical protein